MTPQIRLVATVLCLAAAGALHAEKAPAPTRLLPVDQAASVPDFFSFRARLQAAVARHDTAAVLDVLAKDVKLSFGGDDGIEAFAPLWNPEATDSRLWDTLARVLALGGSFDAQGRFAAPYTYSRWPAGIDVFSHVAAVGSGVRVRSAAEEAATIIGQLDFDIVPLADQSGERTGWTAIKLPSGQIGHVHDQWVRSPIDFRVGFSKKAGRWQIDYFVAGD
jgi:hypothetical protein